VLENRLGKLTGIEVKASGKVDGSDFNRCQVSFFGLSEQHCGCPTVIHPTVIHQREFCRDNNG
jgi:hypothetical protein